MAIGERELRLTLPPDPRAVGEARDAVQGSLVRARPDVCEDVRLMVSELVTNSLRHGGLRPGDEILVRVHATDDCVRVEVTDHGHGFDPASVPDPSFDAAGGFGLHLIRQLANRWGVEPKDGVNVWFELDHPFEPETSGT